jgi:DNA-binding response OmpR family regulator
VTTGGSKRILVVDDDEAIRQVASLALAGAGYCVKTVSDGETAIDEARAWLPDLVLLDVNMPGMDGWEALRLIKIDDALRHLPVVMFTIKGEVRDKVHALQDGASDFITKPFGYDELLSRVERILLSLGTRS